MKYSEITSSSNPRIKSLLSLKDRPARKESGLALVDGERESERALDSGVKPRQIFFSQAILKDPQAEGFLKKAQQQGADLFLVSDRLFKKVSFGQRAGGIVSVFQPTVRLLSDIRINRGIICVADGLEKPGNIGALIRTAESAGADACILADPVTDIYNPNLIRSSIASVFSLTVVEAKAQEALNWLKGNHVAIFSACPKAEVGLWELKESFPCAVVIGSEKKGLSDLFRRSSDQLFSIPQFGSTDSLNASLAAAISVYELLRRRQKTP